MHSHLYELPGWLAKKDSDVAKYRDEVLLAMGSLRYTHAKVQTSASRARFLVQENSSNSVFDPDPQEVYDAVQEFVYHYENYCHRAYGLREKILHYVNAALQLRLPPREVNLRNISMQRAVKDSGLNTAIDKFRSGNSAFGKLIKHRKSLTHHISYESDRFLRPEVGDAEELDFREWSKMWSRNILNRAKEVEKAELQTSSLNHILAEKVIEYREPLRPMHRRTSQ